MIKSLLTLFIGLTALTLYAQDPHRFDTEIDSLKKLPVPQVENVAVFTGSSSIRLWENLANDCRNFKAINTGFGGSQTSDLLYFVDALVLRYQAPKVFIYEGDNDINAGKSPDVILSTMKKLVAKIHNEQPNTQIYLISAKPSLSRWSLKTQYERFNSLLNGYCQTAPWLHYIDVWQIMLDNKGQPKADIFIADSLHMNSKGYALWKDKICAENR